MHSITSVSAAPPLLDWPVLLAKLSTIEAALAELRSQQTIRDWYSTDEVAKLLGKAEFTVREWCRLGRVHAEKRGSGRGAFKAWVISHIELQRLQREGLLPFLPRTPNSGEDCHV
jgi:Helix-turn-helix domain